MSTDIPLRPLKKNSSDSPLATFTSRMASSSRRKQQQRYLDTPEDEVTLLGAPAEELESPHDDLEVEEPVVRICPETALQPPESHASPAAFL